MPQAKYHVDVKAIQDGYITSINAESIGLAAMLLGAGRAKKEDKIDHAAGVTMIKKVGDWVKAGDTLCVLHANIRNTKEAELLAAGAFQLGNEKPEANELIHAVIE